MSAKGTMVEKVPDSDGELLKAFTDSNILELDPKNNNKQTADEYEQIRLKEAGCGVRRLVTPKHQGQGNWGSALGVALSDGQSLEK